MQLFPNPLVQGQTAMLGIEVQKPTHVAVQVHNQLGQVVYSLPTETLQAGAWHYELPTAKLAAGLYYVTTQLDGVPHQHRMVVLE